MVNLERLSGSMIRQRGSIPKIVILDNGIISAMSGLDFKSAKKDTIHWGRCVENVVGARLYYLAEQVGGQVFYWRERQHEMDYALKVGKETIGIEVKTNAEKVPASFSEFERRFKPQKVMTICYRQGSREIDRSRWIGLEEFLMDPYVVLKRGE